MKVVKRRFWCIAYFMLTMLICSCFTACQSDSEYNTIELDRKVLPMVEGGGYSYGLYDIQGQIEVKSEFKIDQGSSFEKILSVGNYYEEDVQFKLIILANSNKINFVVNNEQVDEYDIVIKGNQATQIPIKLEGLKEGKYTLDYIMFKNTDQHDLEEDFRKQFMGINHMAYQCMLQVGEGETFRYDNIKMETDYSSKENTTGDIIHICKDENRLSGWLMETVKTGEKLNFYVHAGNSDNISYRYDIIIMYNWDIYNILSLCVPPQTMVTIPQTIEVGKEVGVGELTVLRIEYNDEDSYKHTIDSSLRVGINIV